MGRVQGRGRVIEIGISSWEAWSGRAGLVFWSFAPVLYPVLCLGADVRYIVTACLSLYRIVTLSWRLPLVSALTVV